MTEFTKKCKIEFDKKTVWNKAFCEFFDTNSSRFKQNELLNTIMFVRANDFREALYKTWIKGYSVQKTLDSLVARFEKDNDQN
jgi:hypothetical protein